MVGHICSGPCPARAVHRSKDHLHPPEEEGEEVDKVG